LGLFIVSSLKLFPDDQKPISLLLSITISTLSRACFHLEKGIFHMESPAEEIAASSGSIEKNLDIRFNR